jgi:hypothetical protein
MAECEETDGHGLVPGSYGPGWEVRTDDASGPERSARGKSRKRPSNQVSPWYRCARRRTGVKLRLVPPEHVWNDLGRDPQLLATGFQPRELSVRPAVQHSNTATSQTASGSLGPPPIP